MTRLRIGALASALLAAAPAHALGFPDFAGSWRIERSSSPAWIAAPLPARNDLLGATIAFEARDVRAPSPLGCRRATYEVVETPPQSLFQGGINQPVAAATARELGLSDVAAPTLRVACDTGSFDYHLDEAGGLMIMLDNVLYHFVRQPAVGGR
jgi:hypothetical protein